MAVVFFFFSSRRRHTRFKCDWSSDVCSSDLFYGIDYPDRDLRLGVVDASSGKIGSPIDRVLLLCYQYDPTTARYATAVLRLLRLAGVLTVEALVLAILIFRRRNTTI